jgi:endonuclease/exonuclease/phosphatase family metal-dependent hydrolase
MMSWRILAIVALVLQLSACSEDDEHDFEESLSVSTYNLGLALNFVPYTNERLVANEALLADYDSDVLCLQEVWLDDQVEAVKTALSAGYPHMFTVPAQQVFSAEAACTSTEIAGFAECANTQCSGLSGSALVACAPAQCGAFFAELSPGCVDGVIAAVGIPDVTVADLVETVTQPAGIFAYDGALGLILASKYPLQNREFQDFVDDSSANHRGALYAEITLNERKHVVGCTHPTANLAGTIDYPPSGKHGSWEGENRFMQQEMIAFANRKAGNSPIFFGGDFNCSIANPANGVTGEFADNCQLWLDDGFVDPAGEQSPCTFCYDENLILLQESGTGTLVLDHVFVKNLANADAIRAERVFDETVSIESLVPASELAPEDSPLLTHPSDHFGIELDIRLP